MKLNFWVASVGFLLTYSINMFLSILCGAYVSDDLECRMCSSYFLCGQVGFPQLVYCVMGWIPLVAFVGSNTCCFVDRFE